VEHRYVVTARSLAARPSCCNSGPAVTTTDRTYSTCVCVSASTVSCRSSKTTPVYFQAVSVSPSWPVCRLLIRAGATAALTKQLQRRTRNLRRRPIGQASLSKSDIWCHASNKRLSKQQNVGIRRWTYSLITYIERYDVIGRCLSRDVVTSLKDEGTPEFCAWPSRCITYTRHRQLQQSPEPAYKNKTGEQPISLVAETTLRAIKCPIYGPPCTVQLLPDVSTCVVPRTHTGFGDRAFQVAGPRLWHSLPASLRQSDTTVGQFKKLLKTRFLTQQFNCCTCTCAARRGLRCTILLEVGTHCQSRYQTLCVLLAAVWRHCDVVKQYWRCQ